MKYILKNASKENIEYLKKCKFNNIFEYASEITKQEKMQIKNYVEEKVLHQIKDYKLIVIDNKIVGCVLEEQQDDGFLLDEIYIENEYRNKGIGTKIIKDILNSRKLVYLWVYKLNEKAVKLYKKLGFNIIEETKTRYYMKYEKS